MGSEVSFNNRISSFKTPSLEYTTQKSQNCLEEETSYLQELFDEQRFSQKSHSIGLELEMCLLDKKNNPSPKNTWMLKKLPPSFVTELSRYNIEYNSPALKLHDLIDIDQFQALQKDWELIKSEGNSFDHKLSLIGILPTLTKTSLQLKDMTPKNRYRLLNRIIMEMRDKKPFTINISGEKDILHFKQKNVMAGAATTSLQVHLQVPFSQSVQAMNASSLASAPLVALAANSPFLYAKELWDETRIPLFEQSVDPRMPNALQRSTFGSSYVKDSLFELFEENLEFPALFDLEHSSNTLENLKLHNGTIWRWNRPILGNDLDGTPHLRIEQRMMSAGPTFIDVVANSLFSVGLTLALCEEADHLVHKIPFAQAKNNFYQAAKCSLDAKIKWAEGEITIQELLLEELIPKTRHHLERLTSPTMTRQVLDEVIIPRVTNKQTGSSWQKKFIHKNGKDFHQLMQTYLEFEGEGLPVHLWSS